MIDKSGEHIVNNASMERGYLLLFNQFKKMKVASAAAGLIVTPTSLFLAYHIAKISISRINLDILELERRKLGYAEYLESAPLIISSQIADGPDKSRYISGPRKWREVKRRPKYWANLARCCGPVTRNFAIELLSRSHGLSDWVYYSAALACDSRTLIELSRIEGTDIRLFLSPRKLFDGREHLSNHLYRLLRQLPSTADDCTNYYTDILLGRTPPVVPEDWNDIDDDDVEFTAGINVPRRADLSLPPQSLASLTSSTLNVIWHLTRQPEQRHEFVYKNEGLQLLIRIWFVFKSDEKMMCQLAKVLINLSQDKAHHDPLVRGGFLHMLVMWTKSLNRQLKCTAASALANLCDCPCEYPCGVYLFHPIFRQSNQPDVDVVFIHGVNGGAFRTWRQHDSMKETNDFSTCWPRDWLSEEFGGGVRALGVDYSSNATYWDSKNPCLDELNIEEQAQSLADKLCKCKLGEDRKIVWVGHSLGGIMIKHILTMANTQQKYEKILASTKAVIFMGVPHRGCPMAQFTKRTSYIAFPTAQLRELADTVKLSELNQRFIELATDQHISCKSFIEGSKTVTPASFSLRLVPPQYAEFEIGENVILDDENHITICKPRDRDSRVFKEIMETIYGIIDDQPVPVLGQADKIGGSFSQSLM